MEQTEPLTCRSLFGWVARQWRQDRGDWLGLCWWAQLDILKRSLHPSDGPEQLPDGPHCFWATLTDFWRTLQSPKCYWQRPHTTHNTKHLWLSVNIFKSHRSHQTWSVACTSGHAETIVVITIRSHNLATIHSTKIRGRSDVVLAVITVFSV